MFNSPLTIGRCVRRRHTRNLSLINQTIIIHSHIHSLSTQSFNDRTVFSRIPYVYASVGNKKVPHLSQDNFGKRGSI